jgi:hypothetical protein
MATSRSSVKGRGIPACALTAKSDFVRDLVGVVLSLVGVALGIDDFFFVGVCLDLRFVLLDELELMREKRSMSCFCCVWLAR